MFRIFCVFFASLCAAFSASAKTIKADIIVYGGTSAGVVAAVQAAREGKSVVLVAPEPHLGAMSSAGLGFTDSGKTATIGGASKEFYHRIWLEYAKPESWKFGKKRENFRAAGQGTKSMDDENQLTWIFEPSVAERVYENWLAEYKIPVYKNTYLDRSKKGVRKDKGKIVSFKSLKGDVFVGKVFIDATFEGDLMAAAGCSYTIGREPNSQYRETCNGSRLGKLSGHRHHFQKQVDPYVIKGDPKSGVLKHVSTEKVAPAGEGD
ncbi:MAG: FAD-dependent oxidoreductase [Opitutales bacterium]|nr:FAD-dependent oxidoreductase [Opitutales bacterium]